MQNTCPNAGCLAYYIIWVMFVLCEIKNHFDGT